jgi:hypothetical protein
LDRLLSGLRDGSNNGVGLHHGGLSRFDNSVGSLGRG